MRERFPGLFRKVTGAGVPSGFLGYPDLRRTIASLVDHRLDIEQIRPASVDLTLGGIYNFSSSVDIRGVLSIDDFFRNLESEGKRVDFNSNGAINLPKGAYIIRFQERMKSFPGMAFLLPRSTLFRIGCNVEMRIIDGSSPEDGYFSVLRVLNPYGLRLERGARVAQAVLYLHGKEPVAISSPLEDEKSLDLRIGKIFRFIKGGNIGVNTRDTDIYEEVIDDRIDLSDSKPYLVELSEEVCIPLDQFWLAATRYHSNGLLTIDKIGGLGDPGFRGKWQMLVVNIVPPRRGSVILRKGESIPGFYIKRFPIRKIEKSMGYKGAYGKS